ncbi:MAG: hypothetical protein HOP29_17080 [Phycisphaerales bacterium]|nr:hypothetical protein [Phycisphaerales bacterium]
MAVASKPNPGGTPPGARSDFKGRHLAIGGNVVFTVGVVIAIAVVVQWLAYLVGGQLDVTTSGVNSLSLGTEKLLHDLDQKVHLTSFYFQTDLEEGDQSKYRSRIDDLLALYQSANRSQIEIEQINPLKDLAKRKKLVERISGLKRFQDEMKPHQAVIDYMQDTLSKRITDTLQESLDAVTPLVGEGAAEAERNDLLQIHGVLEQWPREIADLSQAIDDATHAPQPMYGAATSKLGAMYGELGGNLKAIADYAGKLLEQRPGLSTPARSFLTDAQTKYAGLITELEAEAAKIRELKPLELENVLQQLGDTTNALVVTTDDSAKVVAFSDVWDAADPNLPNPGIEHRIFRGEQKLTAAILNLTQKETAAVVFVRYGGEPLFFAGMPGQQFARAPYAQLKSLLEDANFTVHEWDVSTAASAPEIDPPPTRSIYVVLRPSPPPGGPFAQSQQQPFNDTHMQSVVNTMGDKARAVFLAGWAPSAFGMIPAPYEYAPYLNDQWGINIDSNVLVLKVAGVGPGKFQLTQASGQVREFNQADHVLVRNITGQTASFPLVAPVEIMEKKPDGVTVEPLLWAPRSETLWGVHNPSDYVQKARAGEDFEKTAEDELGPFNLAAAAQKGESKILVISSPNCMTDDVALAPALVRTSRGYILRQQNPGNVSLLLNGLHWLNDKVEWMELGRPANTGSIEIAQGPTLTFIKVFAAGIWPLLVVGCGLVAWRIRRR